MKPTSSDVLAKLVKTGMWCSNDSISKFRRFILDVDSVIDYLYRLCLKRNLKRQVSLNRVSKSTVSLLNYKEFSQVVGQLFRYFEDHRIEVILVYGGKNLEAQLFGNVAAECETNSSQVAEQIRSLSSDKPIDIDRIQRPNLALNIFKMIVEERRKSKSSCKISPIQAYYHSFPVMAKLARDFQCPVITNDGSFIVYDVRAGFILFDEFWFHHIELHDLVINRDKSTSRSLERKSKKRSPRGRVVMSGPTSPNSADIRSRFHYHFKFLRQHPGLSSHMALNLIPLSRPDFCHRYASSLRRMNIFDNDIDDTNLGLSRSSKGTYGDYQMAANRLEMTIRFLIEKNHRVMTNLMRSQTKITNSNLLDDYTQLYYYYNVAHELKFRLRYILKSVWDPVELNFIEWCLVNRHCTADYLLNLLTCSIGPVSSINYNRYMQFEDVQTNHSALSMADRSRYTIMSLLQYDTQNRDESSSTKLKLKPKSKSRTSTETKSKYSSSFLAIFDRKQTNIIQRTLSSSPNDPKLRETCAGIQLDFLAYREVKRENCAKCINFVFKSDDLTRIPNRFNEIIKVLLGDAARKVNGSLTELAISLNLFRFCSTQAATGDKYFEQSYRKLLPHFERAIFNSYILQYKQPAKSNKTDRLVQMIQKRDYSTTAQPIGVDHDEQQSNDLPTRLRHLIELFNSTLEAYLELNALLNFSMPRLKLHKSYNPILIYNLAVYSIYYDDKIN